MRTIQEAVQYKMTGVDPRRAPRSIREAAEAVASGRNPRAAVASLIERRATTPEVNSLFAERDLRAKLQTFAPRDFAPAGSRDKGAALSAFLRRSSAAADMERDSLPAPDAPLVGSRNKGAALDAFLRRSSAAADMERDSIVMPDAPAAASSGWSHALDWVPSTGEMAGAGGVVAAGTAALALTKSAKRRHHASLQARAMMPALARSR